MDIYIYVYIYIYIYIYILTSRRCLASALRRADSDSALAAAVRAVACSASMVGSQHTLAKTSVLSSRECRNAYSSSELGGDAAGGEGDGDTGGEAPRCLQPARERLVSSPPPSMRTSSPLMAL